MGTKVGKKDTPTKSREAENRTAACSESPWQLTVQGQRQTTKECDKRRSCKDRA